MQSALHTDDIRDLFGNKLTCRLNVICQSLLVKLGTTGRVHSPWYRALNFHVVSVCHFAQFASFSANSRNAKTAVKFPTHITKSLLLHLLVNSVVKSR